MAELFQIGRVLIISPTSLKYQWKAEIEKFCNRTAQVVEGLNQQRRQLYRSDSFYKLINYELVARDMDRIREWSPDLIILDEAQRIKNWKTRTAKTVKELESTFALVLTGIPIENRIEELHSLMEFVDRHHLGPFWSNGSAASTGWVRTGWCGWSTSSAAPPSKSASWDCCNSKNRSSPGCWTRTAPTW